MYVMLPTPRNEMGAPLPWISGAWTAGLQNGFLEPG